VQTVVYFTINRNPETAKVHQLKQCQHFL